MKGAVKMITEQEYKNYFGVTTAPTNFTRLLFISEQILKSFITQTITEECKNDYKKAVMEQMKYLDHNSDILEEAGSRGASLGKYSEGSSGISKSNEIKEIISPITYSILLNCGLLYAGQC